MRMARKLRNKGFEVTCPAEYGDAPVGPGLGVLDTYPIRGTRIPGGIGYRSHHIYSRQEKFTLWEPEEHPDHSGYTNGGWTCGAQLRGL